MRRKVRSGLGAATRMGRGRGGTGSVAKPPHGDAGIADDGAAQRLHARDGEAVGHRAVAAQQLETVAEGRELDRAARRAMVERVAHLLLRHGAELRGAEMADPVHQAADGNFMDPLMLADAEVTGIERNVAAMIAPGAVETAVEAKAERRERAQRVVVGAEIA